MDKTTRTINIIKKLLLEGWYLQIGVSGKDSFCVAHCAVKALKEAIKINPKVGPVYFSTVDTTIDNFEIVSFLRECHHQLDEYAQEHSLPVITKIIEPTTQQRPLVQYIGRGLLLRTMTNQTGRRQCTSDWKITPTIKFNKQIQEKHQTTKVLNLSGSRDEESVSRAANLAKRGESIDVITTTDMGYKLAPIKDWTLSDVWGLINKIDNGDEESFGENLTTDLRKHYSAGNSGTCDLFVGNSTKNNKPCSNRFGCFLCSLVAEDKSLTNQIEASPKTYGYMKGPLNLRQYMFNTLNDFKLTRAQYGKKLINKSHIKLDYNDYSMAYRAQLLRLTLTLDAIEIERAETIGEEAKFQLIDYPSIVTIQYFWSKEGGESSPGEALKIWHDVHTFNKRYAIPDTSYVAPQPNPKNDRFFDVNKAINELSFDGLSISTKEKTRFKTHQIKSHGETILCTPFYQSKNFEIGLGGSAWEYVEETFLNYLEQGTLTAKVCPSVILKDLLRLGVVKVAQGHLARLHKQVQRAQLTNYIVANQYELNNYFMACSENEKLMDLSCIANTSLDAQLSLL